MKIPYKDIFMLRNFKFLLLARLFKKSSSILFGLELIWLTMEITNNSPLYLSMMVMAGTLPFVFLGVYGGSIADRLNKKKLIVWSDSMIAILIILIPIFYFSTGLNFWIALLLYVIISTLNCFSEPSFRAILPEIIEDEKLQKGNAILDSIQRGASILIPATISIIIFFTSQIHIFTFSFILILISILCHSLIKYTPSIKKSDHSIEVENDIKHTFKYLKKNKVILFIIVVQGISILINTGLWRVGLPLYLDVDLNEDVGTYGIIAGVLGVSAFLTSLILGLLKNISHLIIFNVGILLWGVGLIIIGLFPSMFTIYIATVLIGIGQSSEGLSRLVIIQKEVPKEILGKVFSISSSVNYTSDTISLAVISSILILLSTSNIFFLSGSLIFLTGLSGFKYFKKNFK